MRRASRTEDQRKNNKKKEKRKKRNNNVAKPARMKKCFDTKNKTKRKNPVEVISRPTHPILCHQIESSEPEIDGAVGDFACNISRTLKP
mmetsp:Transcript_14813/g.30152  ORF Transcript_14813/g.30152 Transcript_14813/m.30152 type:complete len:89 (-) Transcript_14813:704-970(-)